LSPSPDPARDARKLGDAPAHPLAGLLGFYNAEERRAEAEMTDQRRDLMIRTSVAVAVIG
jgi:hypothetical protein